ncbi:DUF3307 domain-containing protein [Anaerocolumna sp. AGMB13025]|uniref:DUF3307 domain-containing protein n=1 Tax=Anaerocolumna sp. AGMB13025 TaxID=3039116 RepID=UPI00241D0828|nr:DUF3307 domain-containing protein [Anaerocolumna sp. AGMB13025]WFR57192.1 DUF3307 domain-containing protein [Anaerocolumna sp. AGMB13025]
MSCALLLIGHLLGDFYLQSNSLARGKIHSFHKLMRHCLIYSAAMGAMVFPGIPITSAWLIFGFLITSHGMIDLIKCGISRKTERNTRHRSFDLELFLADQFIHLIVIVLLVLAYPMSTGNTPVLLMIEDILNIGDMNKVLWMITAYLICGKPSAVFVKMLLAAVNFRTQATPVLLQAAAIEDAREAKKKGLNILEVQKSKNIGAAIGILEREIILTLSLLGQFSAIGFVITAKSIARFKQLEDKDFAEIYLIGTLVSVLIAIGCAVLFSEPILHKPIL